MTAKEHAQNNDQVNLKQHSPDAASEMAAQQPISLAPFAQRKKLDPRALSPRVVQRLQRSVGNQAVIQRLAQTAKPQAVQNQVNRTGLPDNLKSGIENLSGYAIDDVSVHYNSAKPAQVQALAYTQGTDIHVGPGAEKHLPHEAWHVVQQKQGRVTPRVKLNDDLSLNDDAGLENEADRMGTKALNHSTVETSDPLIETPSASSAAPIQKVSKVYVGEVEIQNNEGEGGQIFEDLNRLTNNFEGEVWFNSREELDAYLQGQSEGIGVWLGRWLNFTGKGPIVFGEEHSPLRDAFIQTLNIGHCLIEAFGERSLTGVNNDDIPDHAIKPKKHKLYDGKTGQALENYWLRAALSADGSWGNFEDDLREFSTKPFFGPIKRCSLLSELLTTIAGVNLSQESIDNGGEVSEELLNAQSQVQTMRDFGIESLLAINEHNRRMGEFDDVIAPIHEVDPWLKHMAVSFASFRASIQRIGLLHFQAKASEEELQADEVTKENEDPLKVWAGRRELFMLRNLEHALGQNPAPLLITMGEQHAKNKRDEINNLLAQHGGRLLIGSLEELANIGAERD